MIPPEGRTVWKSRLAETLLALLVVATLITWVSPVMRPPGEDEYILVYDAQRVFTGQVPYRDFFNIIPPGNFGYLALFYALMGGGSLTAARWATAAAVAGGWLCLRYAFRKDGWPGLTASLLAAIYPVALFPFWPFVSHHWFALSAACGFYALAKRAGADCRAIPAFFLGVSATLSGLFVQFEGVVLAAFGLCLLSLLGEKDRRWRIVPAFLGGLAVPLLFAFLTLAAMGAVGPLAEDLLFWPLRNYSRGANTNVQFPLADLPGTMAGLWSQGTVLAALAGTALILALLATAVVAVGLAAMEVWRIMKRRSLSDPWAASACLATFLGIGLYLRGRCDWVHLVWLLALVGPPWLLSFSAPGRLGARSTKILVLMALLLLGASLAYHRRGLWWHWPALWEFTDADRPVRESKVVRFLRSPGVLPEGDTVAAFPNGGEVYLYTGKPATGYSLLLPLSSGYNDVGDHEKAARQLVQNRARWVLVRSDQEGLFLVRPSPIGDLLHGAYVRQGQLGGAVFYLREGEAPPASAPLQN